MPSAETVGWLIRFGDVEARSFGLSLLPIMLERAREVDQHSPGEVVGPLRRLAGIEVLPGDARAELATILRDIVCAAVERDPTRWATYCLKPTVAMPTPDSLAAIELADLVRRCVEWDLSHQDPDGSFAPNWSWFGAFPEVWPIAEREWRGKIALDMLRSLDAWGM